MSSNTKELSTVLIIDDSEIDTLIHRKTLERIKHVREIHTVSSGTEAIELLKGYSSLVKPLPDIILLDLNMPIMDGFAFIETFRDAPLSGKENVTIVIVSSSSSQSDMNKATELGINHFVMKPLTEEKILAALGVNSD